LETFFRSIINKIREKCLDSDRDHGILRRDVDQLRRRFGAIGAPCVNSLVRILDPLSSPRGDGINMTQVYSAKFSGAKVSRFSLINRSR
jgi:hypothetical protein